MSSIKYFLVFLFYRLLIMSWRVRVYEHPKMLELLKNNQPLILAHWHGHELALLLFVRRYKLATMTSTSKDGAIINYVIHKLGGATSRGSSTRGGVSALKGLLRLLRAGHVTSIAVDGPRGPIYKVKPGVFELSRLGRAHIVPVGVTCSRALHFEKAWNKAFIPYPFARIQAVFNEPIAPLSRDMDARSEEGAKQLAIQIDNATSLAAKLIAGQNSEC